MNVRPPPTTSYIRFYLFIAIMNVKIWEIIITRTQDESVRKRANRAGGPAIPKQINSIIRQDNSKHVYHCHCFDTNIE
jgi:hypothetical protein